MIAFFKPLRACHANEVLNLIQVVPKGGLWWSRIRRMFSHSNKGGVCSFWRVSNKKLNDNDRHSMEAIQELNNLTQLWESWVTDRSVAMPSGSVSYCSVEWCMGPNARDHTGGLRRGWCAIPVQKTLWVPCLYVTWYNLLFCKKH